MDIKNNLKKIVADISQINPQAKLVAVTKYASVDQINTLIECGQPILGESRIQDTIQKQSEINQGVVWHMIGHLQTNKVKKAIPLYDCIQSVDSLKLLSKIDSEAALLNKKMDVLIQINIAGDPKKFGYSANAFKENLPQFFAFSNVRVTGIMCIVPFKEQVEETRTWFRKAKSLLDAAKKDYPQLKELSMGMSHDYKIALEEGATLIRVGSRLFE